MKKSKARSGNIAAESDTRRVPHACAAALLAAALIGCGGGAFRDEGDLADRYRPAGRDQVRTMLDAVTDINKTAPATVSAEFTVSGSFGEKKYRLLGSTQFDRGRRALHIAFTDFIFRSPLAVLVQEGDEIRVYYPAERRLYVDDRKRIDLANYGVSGIEFGVLTELITGALPVIEKYTVKQGLTAHDGSGTMLILENPRYFETISFSGSLPDRVLLINRGSGERFEAYLKKPAAREGGNYYGAITLAAPHARLHLDITFSKVILNSPVRVKGIRDLKLPADTKIIQM